MPIRYVIDPESGRMRTLATGPITYAEIRDHLVAEERDGGLAYPELVDARDAVPAFSPADVRTLVALLRAIAERSRMGPTAVVVSTDYAYGMCRMLDLLVEDVCAVQPFRRAEEAEEWLGDAPRPSGGSPHAGTDEGATGPR